MLSQIKQAKYNILLKENILPFFVPLIVSIVIWWNPNFLVPDTYIDIGDTGFPLFPRSYLQKISSAWIHDELGFPNLNPSILLPYFIISLLDYFSIPFWLINRLWLVIPTAMVGWSTFYLYNSIFAGKYAAMAGLIAVIFSMLPTEYSIIPLWYISLSGFSLALAVLIRSLNNRDNFSWRYPVLAAIASILLIQNPRCLYLAVITIFLYLSIRFLYDREIYKIKAIRFFIISSIMIIFVNAYWAAPFLYYKISGNSAIDYALSSATSGKDIHREVLLAYKSWSHPSKIIRLTASGFAGEPYIKQLFIYPFTFIMPLYAYASIFLAKGNKNFLPIKIITPLFIVFASSMHLGLTRKIYLYLWDNFPGFFVLNSPRYWLFVLGIFYAILTGATTQELLSKIDFSKYLVSLRIKIIAKRSLIALLLILIGVVYGGGLLIGISPQENVFGNKHIYGNHISAAKIPKEYFELSDYLRLHSTDGDRIVNLPWSNDAYRVYKWFSASAMPEIIYSLSVIPVTGFWNSHIYVKSAVTLLKQNHANAISGFKGLGVKFIVLHKDYQRVEGLFNPEDYTSYEGILDNSQYLEKAMDNLYFNLYLIKDKSAPSVYLLQQGMKNEGDKGITLPDKVELLKFNGENYIDLGNHELLKFKDRFTISHWVYMDKNTAAPQGIFTKNAGSGDINDNYFTMVQNNKVWFPINLGKQTIAYHGGAVDRNEWYHVAVVFDKGKSEYILYINEIPVAVNRTQGAIIPSASPVLIGAYGGNNPIHFFKGFITNIQIYGESLTYDEIQKLYLSGVEGEAIKNRGLRGWWKLDRRSIEEAVVKDLSGNNLQGIIKGQPIYDSIIEPAIYASNINNDVATVTYRKISDTEYKINPIDNDSFYLVFNQAFHPLWKAFVGEMEVIEHSPTEIGMNKWLIKEAKNREITIIFSPQKWFNIGLLISSFFWLAVILMTAYLKYIKAFLK